jgi:hypothetical protein
VAGTFSIGFPSSWCFTVLHGAKREEFPLVAGSEADCDVWITALRSLIVAPSAASTADSAAFDFSRVSWLRTNFNEIDTAGQVCLIDSVAAARIPTGSRPLLYLVHNKPRARLSLKPPGPSFRSCIRTSMTKR